MKTYIEKPSLGIMPLYIWRESLESLPPSYEEICNRQADLRSAIRRCKPPKPEWLSELIWLEDLKAEVQP